MLLLPLARFASVLQSPLMHFWAIHHYCWNAFISKTCFLLRWDFSLCCYGFFSLCICKISDAFFLLVFVLYFAACCHVCLAKLFIGLFACWFNFYDFMLDYVVPSFFVMCLYITSLIFVAEILTFAFSVCCRCFSNSILVCVDVPTALFYVCFGTVLEYALNCTRQFVLKCCCLLFASFLLILCHHFLLHFFLGMTYLCVLVFPFLLPPQLVFLFSRVA